MLYVVNRGQHQPSGAWTIVWSALMMAGLFLCLKSGNEIVRRRRLKAKVIKDDDLDNFENYVVIETHFETSSSILSTLGEFFGLDKWGSKTLKDGCKHHTSFVIIMNKDRNDVRRIMFNLKSGDLKIKDVTGNKDAPRRPKPVGVNQMRYDQIRFSEFLTKMTTEYEDNKGWSLAYNCQVFSDIRARLISNEAQSWSINSMSKLHYDWRHMDLEQKVKDQEYMAGQKKLSFFKTMIRPRTVHFEGKTKETKVLHRYTLPKEKLPHFCPKNGECKDEEAHNVENPAGPAVDMSWLD